MHNTCSRPGVAQVRCCATLVQILVLHNCCTTVAQLLHSCRTAATISSSCFLCLAPPAVDLLEALCRCLCIRDGLASSVCVCRTSAASVELLPRGWRAVAFPRSLHVQSCSTWLILIVRCCFGGLCVRGGLACSVCICRTSAASVEPLPRGWRAVAIPRWLSVLNL